MRLNFENLLNLLGKENKRGFCEDGVCPARGAEQDVYAVLGVNGKKVWLCESCLGAHENGTPDDER